MRLAHGTLVLVLLAGACLAQEAPPSAPPPQTPLRVAIDVTSKSGGEADAKNLFAYFLWERLNAFGVRVEVARPVGDERLDAYIQKKAARWEKEQPNAAPASLTITGGVDVAYDDAQFFGQAQAHSFKGRAEVDLKRGSGEQVHRVAVPHDFGRGTASGLTKQQVRDQYNNMLFTGVVLAILTRPEVQAGIPEGKKAEAATFVTERKASVLKSLEGAGLKDCDLAKLLRDLPEPGKAADGKGSK